MQLGKSTVAFPQEAQDYFPNSNLAPKPEHMLFLLIIFSLVITMFIVFIDLLATTYLLLYSLSTIYCAYLTIDCTLQVSGVFKHNIDSFLCMKVHINDHKHYYDYFSYFCR